MKKPASPFQLVCLATAFLIAACSTQNSPNSPLGTESDDFPNYSEKDLDSLLEADSLAINSENFDQNTPTTPDSKWALRAILTDLSISASGVIGPLLMKGTPAVTLVWRQKENDSSETAAEQILNWQEAARTQAAHLDPVLKESLAEHVERFKNLVRGIEASHTQGEWYPSRLRLDLGVDVSGKLSPVISIGGDVRVRLEWYRSMKIQNTPTQDSGSLTQLEENMLGFVNKLSDDLETLSSSKEVEKLHHFRAKQYRLGFGITETLSIGAAKSVYSTYGHIYFSRSDRTNGFGHGVKELPASGDESTFSILDAPNGDSFHVTSQNEYKVKRENFRKGLIRAIRLGALISKSAEKTSKRKWKIKEIKAGFDLTLTGSSKEARLAGIGTSEISFANQKF